MLLEGAELYAFVPANSNTSITVYPSAISENGEYINHKDVPSYTGKPGETVVLRCNLSEIYANVLLSIADGIDMLEFHPFLSMKDGHIALEPGCFDFSVYEKSEENAVENARSLLLATDEVGDALQRGMQLLFTGDTQRIDDHDCLLFALGTDHEEQFVRKQLYAVSGDQIYIYLPESDTWQVLGQG